MLLLLLNRGIGNLVLPTAILRKSFSQIGIHQVRLIFHNRWIIREWP